jgi:hypothetical protein
MIDVVQSTGVLVPFDPKREFVKCVLCDGEPMTREHLFGESLARALDIPINAVGTGRNSDGQAIPVNTGAPLLSSVSVCLCENCNNVRFHAMMGRAQPLIVQLARGQKRSLSTEDIDDLLRYFERLGFLVDALSSNYELTDEYRASPHFEAHAHWHGVEPVYSLIQRKVWLEGAPDAVRPRIYLGRHLGVLGLNPETNLNRQTIRDPAQSERRYGGTRQFHICIGQLAVHIRMGDDGVEFAPSNSYVRLALPGPLAWPPAPRNVDYDDFFALYEQDGQTLFLRGVFRVPVTRIIEEEVRRRKHRRAVQAAKAEQAAARKNGDEARARKEARRQAAHRKHSR